MSVIDEHSNRGTFASVAVSTRKWRRALHSSHRSLSTAVLLLLLFASPPPPPSRASLTRSHTCTSSPSKLTGGPTEPYHKAHEPIEFLPRWRIARQERNNLSAHQKIREESNPQVRRKIKAEMHDKNRGASDGHSGGDALPGERDWFGGRVDSGGATEVEGVWGGGLEAGVVEVRREVAAANASGAGEPSKALGGDREGLGEAAWAWLQGLSVGGCAVSDVPSLMAPKEGLGVIFLGGAVGLGPSKVGLFSECVMVALQRMRVDPDVEVYKLFFLSPRLVLQPVQRGKKKGVAKISKDRCTRFRRGRAAGKGRAKRLESAKLASATEETLEQLYFVGTGRRRDVVRDRCQELQEQALELDEKAFTDVTCDMPWASGQGTSQWPWKHLWAVHVPGGLYGSGLRKPSGVDFVSGGKMMRMASGEEDAPVGKPDFTCSIINSWLSSYPEAQGKLRDVIAEVIRTKEVGAIREDPSTAMEIAACPLDCFKRHVYAMHYVYNFVKRKEHEDLPDLEDKVDVFAGLLLECHPELYPASKLQEGEAPHFQSVINRTFAEEEQPTQEERTPAAVSDGAPPKMTQPGSTQKNAISAVWVGASETPLCLGLRESRDVEV
ncbi:hypothetical protein CYMTET_39043 [Cymbomonas tetramitiformis]|uniref:Uncharacterized protein n=1 Tax=Cymbomonas tetramitiformis TaxID=36881 RepID=A0AAE0CCB6_9CHLO|nr:hypothetical protein CYMTET_39043 [Cymbomonas tetramitiformis]